MTEKILIQRLRPMAEMESRLWRARALTWLLVAGALLVGGLMFAYLEYGWWDGPLVYGIGIAAVLAGSVIYLAARSKQPDVHEIAQKIETEFPDLHEMLVTAVEQQPQGDGKLSYLQERVVREAIDHAVEHNWIGTIAIPRVKRAEAAQGVALVTYTLLLLALIIAPRVRSFVGGEELVEAEAASPVEYEVSVDPGDAEVEEESRLVVQARFEGELPAGAELVVGADGEEQARFPMVKNLEDPVFGGVIPRIPEDTVYRVEYDGRRTDEFEIKTFAFPKLQQADASVTPPAHLDLPAKTIEDTRSVSAFEGSEVTLEFRTNKPVAGAALTDEDGWEHKLEPVSGKENTYAVSFVPEDSRKFRLNLVDDEDRANKRPPVISVKVKKNLPPKIAIVAPGKDVQPSAIEEVQLAAKLWDDLGLRGFGATFTLNGETHEVPLEKQGVDKAGKEVMTALLDLESLEAAPDDSVTYFVWAEDVDSKGNVRRVSSDMFFADVRHFENLFREMEAPPGEGQQQQGGAAQKLIEMQREIINATWKLIRRETEAKKEDTEVVHESQGIAIGMVDEALEKVEDAKLRAVFEKAKEHMELALEDLGGEELDGALLDEKNAYAELLKARERERNVTQAQKSQSSGQQQQQRERQLMELELKQKEQRYESEKMATEEQNEEQRENLQVLNRLKELARRQEALREEIKELQAALAEAKTEEEKEELKRQLKRLQEEQEQLLRDVDELRERMENEENRARMTAEREQLERTREEVRKASEEMKREELSKAMNATERASQELEELRDEFQRKTSQQFAQEMREMRREARELAEKESEIRGELEEAEGPNPNNPTKEDLAKALENRHLANALGEQSKKAAELMEQMRAVSEQAEESEPLVSDKLYDALRKAQMDQLEESLETARDMTNFGAMAQARKEEDKANKAIQDLKKGIEKAAERILGDEAEALRMARAELDKLIDEVREDGSESGERSAERERREAKGDEEGPGDGSETDRERKMAQQGQEGRQESQQEGEGGPREKSASEEQRRMVQGGQPGGEETPEGEQQQQRGRGQEGERGQEQAQRGKDGGQQNDRERAEQQEGAGQRGEEGQPGQEGQDQKGKEGQGMAQNQQEQGQQEGQEGEQGQQPGQGQQGQGQQGQGQQQAQQGQPGQGQQGQGQQQAQQGQGQSPGGNSKDGQQPRTASNSSRGGGGDGARHFTGGDDGGDRMGGPWTPRTGIEEPLFFESEATHRLDPGPITGSDYRDWSDRLRDVEEMLDDTEMRRLAAQALDRAREYRQDFKRNNQPPNQDLVQRHVAGPLLELRDRVAEELARRDVDTKLVPLDRDPVPNRYRDLVRGYYEKLGAGE